MAEKLNFAFTRCVDREFVTYNFTSLKEVRKWVHDDLEKFKKENKVRDEKKDPFFQVYKRLMEDKITQAEKFFSIEKCDKCSLEDHEGWACRCESRNIEVAKERRKRGISLWEKSEEI